MKKKERHVDVVSPNLVFDENRRALQDDSSFDEILTFLDKKEYKAGGLTSQLYIRRSDIVDCIIGIVITSQEKNIPPKMDKKTKEFSPLNLITGLEGLAFANVFLYDKKHNVLIYERNKNGLSLSYLRLFIFERWNESENQSRFDISFNGILRAYEYERILKMNYYKEIQAVVSNPNELAKVFQEENGSMKCSILDSHIDIGIRTKSDTIKIEYSVSGRKMSPKGLSRSSVVELLNKIQWLIERGFRANFEKVEVKGYPEIDESRKGRERLIPINFLHDTFNESFLIEDIFIQEHVQEQERIEGVKQIYNKIVPEVRRIKG